MKNYNDYWVNFETGEFIGDFESMYKNVEDPWLHGNALSSHYDTIIQGLKELHPKDNNIVDIGCGKGGFSFRIAQEVPFQNYIGFDIAETAIAKANELAKEKSLNSQLSFKVGDFFSFISMLDEPQKILKGSSVLLIDVLWYLLHRREEFFSTVKTIVHNYSARILISLTFYGKENQRYLADVCTSCDELIGLFQKQGINCQKFSNELKATNNKGSHAFLIVK